MQLLCIYCTNIVRVDCTYLAKIVKTFLIFQTCYIKNVKKCADIVRISKNKDPNILKILSKNCIQSAHIVQIQCFNFHARAGLTTNEFLSLVVRE